MSWFGKKSFLKVGDVSVKLSIRGVHIRVNWVNEYLGDAFGPLSIIISPSRPDGVYAGKVEVDELLELVDKIKDKRLKRSNKEYYQRLKNKGISKVGFFVLIVEDNLTSWQVSTEIIDMVKRPLDFESRKKAMSGFLKAFCYKNINRIVTQGAFIVFKDSYDLKGSGKLRPKHFLLRWNEKAAKKQRIKINKETISITDFV